LEKLTWWENVVRDGKWVETEISDYPGNNITLGTWGNHGWLGIPVVLVALTHGSHRFIN
jgi:hypothetical protein